MEPDDTGRLALPFDVEDMGVGIRLADQKRLFDPFEQAGKAADQQARAWVHRHASIVEMMGGTIGLESSPGGGSRFTVELLPDTS